MVLKLPAPILGRYRILEGISFSPDSCVLLAEDTRHGSRPTALKVFRIAGGTTFEEARREFEALRRLRHRGIAEVIDFGRLEGADLEAASLEWTRLLEARRASGLDDSSLDLDLPEERVSPPPTADAMAYMASAYYKGLDLREAFLRLFPTGKEMGVTRPGDLWKVLLEALAAICEALDTVHSRKVIHYDIKPENILLIPSPSEGVPARFEVKILDFGLSEKDTTPLGMRARGTFPYIAPEILENATSDTRSDLYSLGMSIVAAISGRPPLHPASPGGRGAAARASPAAVLRKLDFLVPEPLVSIVESLVRPDPDARPRTAAQVCEEFSRAGGFSIPSARRQVEEWCPMAGSEREIALVREEIDQLRRGEGEKAIITFEGDSGQFLDQVLDEVEVMARLEGVRVVTGACCLPRRYPYQPFAEIAHKVSKETDLTSARFERFVPLLSSIWPITLPPGREARGRKEKGDGGIGAETLAGGGPEQGPQPLKPRLEVYRFIDRLTEFFLELAREAPLVLCLRDLHLGGRETLELARSIARSVSLSRRQRDDPLLPHADSEPPRLLLVGTHREARGESETDEEIAASLYSLGEVAQESYSVKVRLRNLGPDRIEEWIHERAPRLHLEGDLIRRLHEKSGGAPRLLDEFVRRSLDASAQDLLSRDAGTRDGNVSSGLAQRGSVDPPRDPRVLLRLPRQPEDSMLERMEALPPRDRRLLEILAVAHGFLRVEELEAVARAEEEKSDRSSRGEEPASRPKSLEDSGFILLREGPEGLVASMSHPLLAEEIYRQMREDVRAAIHGAIAAALLAGARGTEPSRVPEDVAFHARLGGQDALFFEQALIAARRLAAAHAADAATQTYEQILERLGAGPAAELKPALPQVPGPRDEAASRRGAADAVQLHVNAELATIYLGRGQLHKALEKLTLLSAAHEMSPDSKELAAVYRNMGEVYQQNGEFANASYFLEKSLKLLESRLATLRRRDVRPASGAPHPAEEGGADDIEQQLLLTVLALSRYHVAREDLAEAESVLGPCFGRDGGEGPHREALCRAHVLMAEIESRRGHKAKSLSSSLEALRLAEEGNNRPLLLEVLAAAGWSHMDRGEYDKAIELFGRGIEVARALESKFDMAYFYSSLGTLYHNRADHQRALECFATSLDLNSRIGDLKGIANGHNNLGIVHRLKDDLKRASDSYGLAIVLFGRINDQAGMAAGMNNLSSILELEGKYEDALEYSFRALDRRKKSRSRSGMAFCYYRIGKISQSKGELDKALTYAEKGIQLRREIGEKMGIAYSRLQLSELYLSQGRYSESLRLCVDCLKDFEALENEVGALMAREVLGRILLRLGQLDEAHEIFERLLERSRERGEKMLIGSSLLHLGRILLETGEPYEAERYFSEAEKLFRSLQRKRDLAEALLESCSLRIEIKQLEAASGPLEESYSILEELGVRDLVPWYFLLRSRLEMETSRPDLESAKKFLERGLVESREINLPDLEWRFHHRLGILEFQRGDLKLARIHFLEAFEILEDACQSLPDRFHGVFFGLRERAELKRAVTSHPEDKPAAPETAKPAAGRTPVRLPRRGSGTDDAQREALKLHEIAAAMGTERNLRKLLESIMDAVLELVDAERGFLILKGLDDAEGSMTVARNLDREEIRDPDGKVSESISREVLRTGKPVIARNAVNERRFVSSKSVRDLRLRSLLCVPLRFRKEVLGVVYLDNRHRRDAFRREDLTTLQTFADQAAVAVKNARLIEENRKRNIELEEANRNMVALNQKLRGAVHRRNAQLALAREDLRDRQNQLEDRHSFEKIVGHSEAMQQIFLLLKKISPTELPTLLEGESGTGKELIARAIHFNSTHKEGRFVSQNCGALGDGFLETELFGHTKGAFTGAIADKKGLFEMASEGTLFLDGVDDMSLSMQQKLLRVIQEREVRPVGGKDTIPVNVRIVSAASKDLRALAAEGKFREDLFYRLNGIRIRIPSLRERREDIPLLVKRFAAEAAPEGNPVPQFSTAAIRSLMAHDWPGNVRELRHLVERTLLIGPGPLIREEDILFDAPRIASSWRNGFPLDAAEEGGYGAEGALAAEREDGGKPASLREARDVFEREFLRSCLARTGGNVAKAARSCRLSRESFYRLLRKYGISPPDRKARHR
ncbi:MAG TPA: sigma 54-interacting transcriptional regulator [Planctomycetota bacterium]|nr:sigma 54-interacting transcriptional regulator [Planctomycetota bacterium]